MFGWVLRTQQSLQRELTVGVKSLKGEHAMAGAAMLALLSFLYGVVHAVGPGHGKMVISSYVVANEETVRRGVVISFIAAALQALSAIALVGILAVALNASGLEIKAWSNQLETVSYALIALVGAWLLGDTAHPPLPALAGRAQQPRARPSRSMTAITMPSHPDHAMKARPAITSSMRASLPVRSIGGRLLLWCSRSASDRAPGRSSSSSSR